MNKPLKCINSVLSWSLLLITLNWEGRYRRVNIPPPYFSANFSFLPTLWGNFSLLPKLGLKIGGGQHTTPALSRTVSFLTFRALPLYQHTARRLRNHHMLCIRRFLWRKSPLGYSREFLLGVCRPDLQILTLFQTKKSRYSRPFSDLASKKYSVIITLIIRFSAWPSNKRPPYSVFLFP